MICALMGQLRPSGMPHSRLFTQEIDRSGHDRRYAIDFGKITLEHDWKPRHSFEEGFKATLH